MLGEASGDDVGVPLDGVADGPAAGACDALTRKSIYLADDTGALYRFTEGSSVSLGVPDCIKALTAIASMALSTDGTLWLVGTSGLAFVLDPSGMQLSCKEQLPFKFPPTPTPAVTFLPSSPPAPDPLYAFEGGSLVAISPLTWTEAPIGMLAEASLLGLSATADGILYGVRADPKTPTALLDQINPGDAVVSSTLSIPLPGASAFTGARRARWGAFTSSPTNSTTRSTSPPRRR